MPVLTGAERTSSSVCAPPAGARRCLWANSTRTGTAPISLAISIQVVGGGIAKLQPLVTRLIGLNGPYLNVLFTMATMCLNGPYLDAPSCAMSGGI